MSAEEKRERRLASHRRYNQSAKGQARNRRYEMAKQPDRTRWEPMRNALHFNRASEVDPWAV
jgi:hypothetical protein